MNQLHAAAAYRASLPKGGRLPWLRPPEHGKLRAKLPKLGTCHRLPRSVDALGGAGATDADGLDHCLIHALNSLGIPVTCSPAQRGPFSALQHGNQFLQPFSQRLQHMPNDNITAGKYVMWRADHFVGVRVAAVVTVYDGDITTDFPTIADLIGSGSECMFYKLLHQALHVLF